MGYTTDFSGRLNFNRKLTSDEANFLVMLCNTRRMKRNVGEEYGIEGEFYVEGTGMAGQNIEANVVDANTPPRTQPGLWCHWIPTEDCTGLEWDGGEKFYDYIEWLDYLIIRVFPFITAKGDEPLVLNGELEWQGEESGDVGKIIVKDNKVTTQQGRIAFDDDATRVFFVTSSFEDNEELHETLEDAIEYAKNEMDPGTGRKIAVCIVRNAYREDNGWNYDDNSDTFEEVKVLDIDLRED